MKKSKILMLVALCFMVAGLVVGGISYIFGGRPGFYINASGIHAANSKENNSVYTLEKTEVEAFTKLDISVSYADIRLIPADGYYVEYSLADRGNKPSYGVTDKTFKLKEYEGKTENSFINFFSFGEVNFFTISTDNYYVNLYVPKDVYFDWVHLSNNSGNMKLYNISAKELVLNMDFGNLDMENFEGDSMEARLGSGNMTAGTINTQSLTVENNFGNITCDEATAKTATFSLNSGRLKVGVLKADTMHVDNDFGDVIFDELVNSSGEVNLGSGSFEAGNAVLKIINIDNSFGDVDIRLKDGPDNYSFDLKTDFGDVKVRDRSKDGKANMGSSYAVDKNDDTNIEIYCSSGSIDISKE